MADIDSGKVKWTRLAALGLLLAGLAPVLMLGASFAFGLDVGEDLVFFLTTAAIAFVGAFLVWKFGTWSKFVGILAAVLVAMAMFWTAFGLAQPGSFFDFVPGVLVIPGALVAIGACIAALVARRKGNVTAKPEAGERMGIRVVLGVAVLAAVVSGALTLFTRESASAENAQARVALQDFEFDRDTYEVQGGSTVFVANDDPFFHTFTIDELGMDEGFNAGSSKLIEIPQEPGTYVVYCRPHTSDPEDPAEQDMAATITVV